MAKLLIICLSLIVAIRCVQDPGFHLLHQKNHTFEVMNDFKQVDKLFAPIGGFEDAFRSVHETTKLSG